MTIHRICDIHTSIGSDFSRTALLQASERRFSRSKILVMSPLFLMLALFAEGYTPVIKNGWLENGPLIGDFRNKTSIHRGFSIATFDYRRLCLWGFNYCYFQDLSNQQPDDATWSASNYNSSIVLTGRSWENCAIWLIPDHGENCGKLNWQLIYIQQDWNCAPLGKHLNLSDPPNLV